MRGARIAGWGWARPRRRLANTELAARLGTTEDWIVERTGIHSRRVGGTTGHMAVTAGRQALEHAGRTVDEVDLVVLATTTPDQKVPATVAGVQAELGHRGGGFDVNGACAGSVYALLTAFGFVHLGADRVLVVGADAMSTIIDPSDRDTAVLFGDGAAALVVEAAPGPSPVLGWSTGSEPLDPQFLSCPSDGYLRMAGREVFRRAVTATVTAARAALDDAKLRPGDVDVFVPHQANARIVEAARRRLGIRASRTMSVIRDAGNTSSASIPTALIEALEQGRVADGDTVLLTGFGAGMTWASVVLEWQDVPGEPGPDDGGDTTP